MSNYQVDSILDESTEKKSNELAYLDRVALIGFATLGTVFFIILALALYLNLG
tara:strand:+ start:690 stop:848 length:159 start_codon:yes stop_codon:yes gene_type:complete